MRFFYVTKIDDLTDKVPGLYDHSEWMRTYFKGTTALTSGGNGGIIREAKGKPNRTQKNKTHIELKISKTVSIQDKKTGSELWTEEKRIHIRRNEKILSRNKYETAIVYDKNGDILFRKKGNSDSVEFTKEQMKKLKGNIVTHNHPNNSCFSPADIDMVNKANITELRACTADGVYILRNNGKWDKKYNSFDKIQQRYYEIDDVISKIYLDKVAHEGKTIFDYDDEIQEKTVAKLCEEIGIVFKKEK